MWISGTHVNFIHVTGFVLPPVARSARRIGLRRALSISRLCGTLMPVIGATRRGRSDKGEAAGRHATEGALFDKIEIDRGRSVRRSIRISVRRGE